MKFFIDLFPVVVFFVVYQMRDMYDATAAVMLACAVQTFGYWLFAREFDRNHVLALALVIPFGDGDELCIREGAVDLGEVLPHAAAADDADRELLVSAGFVGRNEPSAGCGGG